MFSRILGYEIFNQDFNSFIEYITDFKKVNIVSGNPEVLYNSLNDKLLDSNLKSSNTIIIPDGIGTIIASKIKKAPVAEKIPGIEVMNYFIRLCSSNGKGIYLLGTKQEILEKCINNLKGNYPGINISGYHNGFFDMDNCNEIIRDIKEKEPFALFVAMGSPRQEKFIAKYMDELPCNIFMGVGGSFDIIAGELKRAPEWMIKLWLEWLYRVCKEPKRIIRLGSIPKFLLKVIRDKN